jgi:hypothetical protein
MRQERPQRVQFTAARPSMRDLVPNACTPPADIDEHRRHAVCRPACDDCSLIATVRYSISVSSLKGFQKADRSIVKRMSPVFFSLTRANGLARLYRFFSVSRVTGLTHQLRL